MEKLSKEEMTIVLVALETLALKNEEMAKEANNLNIQETAKPICEYANSVRKVWEKLISSK